MPPPPPPSHGVLGRPVLVSSLGGVVCSLDSAFNVAFPALSSALGLAPGHIGLLIVAYHVPLAALTVIGGLVGDNLGHRRVFSCGLWISVLAFPLCGLAPSYLALLLARVMQGIGAGLVFGTSPAIVSLGVAPFRRALGLSVLNGATNAALAISPLIGGVLVEALSWRWVFFFRVPVAVLAAGVSLWPLPAAVLISPHRAPRLAAVSRDLLVANALAFAANASFFGLYVFGPYYLVDVGRYSTTVAGILFTLVPFFTSLGGLVSGWFTRRVSLRSLVVAGLLIEVLGLYMTATLGDAVSAWRIAAAFGAAGFGVGFFQVPNMALVMLALPDWNQGVAGAMISTMRTLGIVTAAVLTPWYFALRQVNQARPFLGAFSDTFWAATFVAILTLALASVATAASRRHPSPQSDVRTHQ